MGYTDAAGISAIWVLNNTSSICGESGNKKASTTEVTDGTIKMIEIIEIKINNQINAKYASFSICYCVLVLLFFWERKRNETFI